jgi:hypothetical protein
VFSIIIASLFQFHFVDGYKYPPFPPAMNIVDFAAYEVESRNFKDNLWDEWANNRLTMWVDDLTPYVKYLQSMEPPSTDLVPFHPQFIMRKQQDNSTYSLIVDITPLAGNAMELTSDVFDLETYPNVVNWDFC